VPRRDTSKTSPREEAREQRIANEIIVDAYGPEEQAMGWYYYLQERLVFPFQGMIPIRASSCGTGSERASMIRAVHLDEPGHEVLLDHVPAEELERGD
jgi:hypothetical protein